MEVETETTVVSANANCVPIISHDKIAETSDGTSSDHFTLKTTSSITVAPARIRNTGKIWVYVIGYIQILWSGALLFRSHTLQNSKSDVNNNDIFSQMVKSYGHNVEDIPYAYLASNWKIQLIHGILCSVLGVSLLVGTHLKIQKLLLIWLMVSRIGLVITFLIITSLLCLLITTGAIAALVVLIVFLVPLGFQYLFIRLVSTYHKRLKIKKQTQSPSTSQSGNQQNWNAETINDRLESVSVDIDSRL